MSDLVLQEGDQAKFLPPFPPAIVEVQPGIMPATGPATLTGKKICVAGDELKLSVPGCAYTAPPYVTPGVGTLKIQSLAANQKAVKVTVKGIAALLKGAQFVAVFEVTTPAQQPTASGPVPDSTAKYTGQGSFVTANAKTKAT